MVRTGSLTSAAVLYWLVLQQGGAPNNGGSNNNNNNRHSNYGSGIGIAHAFLAPSTSTATRWRAAATRPVGFGRPDQLGAAAGHVRRGILGAPLSMVSSSKSTDGVVSGPDPSSPTSSRSSS